MKQERLAARLRHDHRLAALRDTARDALAHAVRHAPRRLLVQPEARLCAQLVRLRVEQKDEAAREAARVAEQFERARHRASKVRHVGERLPDFQKRRRLLRVGLFLLDELR